MDEDAELADRFEAHRARLRAVAYHTLGSPSEADDAVQEAWLRLSPSDSGNIENLGGWLTTVVARVCLDMLHSRREEPVGIHLPESAVNESGDDGFGEGQGGAFSVAEVRGIPPGRQGEEPFVCLAILPGSGRGVKADAASVIWLVRRRDLSSMTAVGSGM